ncbi:hypothetical protein [Echinicola sp. 20G]|uniref:hypothetical protein n=1 Tax=Echinicola sp. 20G TaxID=2781961 RepID=UPI001910B2BF|nr:hypothetical protein [Echinicola sp. 20G]
MSLDDFYSLTPLEFSKFLAGFENRKKHDYNLARFGAYFSLKPHLDKAAQNKPIDSLIPFSWEKKKQVQPKKLTSTEVEELRRKWNF